MGPGWPEQGGGDPQGHVSSATGETWGFTQRARRTQGHVSHRGRQKGPLAGFEEVARVIQTYLTIYRVHIALKVTHLHLLSLFIGREGIKNVCNQ